MEVRSHYTFGLLSLALSSNISGSTSLWKFCARGFLGEILKSLSTTWIELGGGIGSEGSALDAVLAGTGGTFWACRAWALSLAFSLVGLSLMISAFKVLMRDEDVTHSAKFLSLVTTGCGFLASSNFLQINCGMDISKLGEGRKLKTTLSTKHFRIKWEKPLGQ